MKQYLYLVICCFLAACNLTPETKSDFGQERTFIKIYGGSTDHVGANALPTDDGGYIFGGTSQVVGNLISQNYTGKMFMLKTDPLGNELWNITPDSAIQSITTHIAIDADGNYVMVGMRIGAASSGGANFDIRVVKISTEGTLLWARNYGDISGESADFATHVAIASNGDYLVIGHTTTDLSSSILNANDTDMYALRIQPSDGNVVWQRIYGRIAPFSDIGVSIAEDSNGDILWFGHVQITTTDKQMRLVKSNSQGNILWDFNYPLSSNNQTAGALLVTNASYTMMGIIDGDYTVMETNKNGTLLWNNTVSQLNGNATMPGSMAYSSDGRLLITGTYRFNNSANDDILLLKLGDRGSYEWHQKFGSGDLDIGRGVIATSDGGILVSGTLGFESNELMMLLKADINGELSK